MPADSWPRCWSAYRPKYASFATSSPGAQTPKTPQASWGPVSWGSSSWVSRPSPRRPALGGTGLATRRSLRVERGEIRQEERFGETDSLELGQVEALVGPVGPGVGVLDAGDQHAGLRERAQEQLDERDRAADSHVNRCDPVPGLGEGVPRDVVRRPGRVDRDRLTGVDERETELGAPRKVLLEVLAK